MKKRRILVMAGIVSLYVVSYFWISRNSLAFNRRFGIDAFYYGPASRPEEFAGSSSLQRVHEFGKVVFYPVWRIDSIFGGPSYISAAPQIFSDVTNSPQGNVTNSIHAP